jgi:glycosyltransferase involved in cell wall biosynthesis
MPRVLLIVAHRLDRSPGQRYRFEQYLPYLEQHGFEFTLANLLDAADDRTFYGNGRTAGKAWVLLKGAARRLRDVTRAQDHDAILLFREAYPLGSTWFERRLHKAGVPMIFDFDDAIWLDSTSDANRRFAWLKNGQKTNELIAMSQIVTAGNAYLANYARQFNTNVRIVPTTIDTGYYTPRDETSAGDAASAPAVIRIGWTGSPTTIEHFRTAIPALTELKQRYGNRLAFTVIGDPSYRNAELDVQSLPWRSATEVQDLRPFDIGIMPLPDDEWTRGKCGAKGLQYMALKIPTVMSPVGVNTEIIRHGQNGMLASTPQEWIDVLSQLIDSAELRRRLGAAGRETVIARYSVLSQRDVYLSIFREACVRRHSP